MPCTAQLQAQLAGTAHAPSPYLKRCRSSRGARPSEKRFHCRHRNTMDISYLDASELDDEFCEDFSVTSQIECIKHIKRLTQKINSIEITPETISHSSKEVKNLLEESNKLALGAYHGSAAALYDTDLISASGRTVSKMTQALEMDSRFFQVKSFPGALKKFMNQSIHSPFTRSDWNKLSTDKTGSLIHAKSGPIIEYTFGSFNFETDANKPQTGESSQKVPYEGKPLAKKPRTKLTISDTRQSAQIINAKTAKEKVEKDRTVIEVENLHDRLNSMSQSNNGDPIPYLSLVVDKLDFGKTVENIFHLSFLIKEGFAEIRVVEMDGERLTVVKCVPPDEREKGDRQRSSAQVALTVTENLWREWCAKIGRRPYRI